MKRYLQFARDVLEEGPLGVTSVLHIVACKLNEVRLDNVINFISHPLRNLIIWTFRSFEMKLIRPNESHWFCTHNAPPFTGYFLLGFSTPHELSKHTIPGHQLVVGALFDNSSLIESKDAVRLIECGQAMGNHDDRMRLPRVIDGCTH